VSVARVSKVIPFHDSLKQTNAGKGLMRYSLPANDLNIHNMENFDNNFNNVKSEAINDAMSNSVSHRSTENSMRSVSNLIESCISFTMYRTFFRLLKEYNFLNKGYQ
jgi:hypothetical protein